MLCVVKEPLEKARITQIDNTLEALQEAVDGRIQVVRFAEGVLAIVDEEGLVKRKPMNILGVVGTYVFCRDGGEDFRSLTQEEAQKLVFVLNNDKKTR